MTRFRRLAVSLLVVIVSGCSRATEPDRSTEIRGVVVDSTGVGIASALTSAIGLSSAADEIGFALTDSAGRFAIEIPRPGPYLVGAISDELVAADTVDAGAGGISDSLTLEPGGVFTGSVTLQGATRHDGIEVATSPWPVVAFTDSSGRYHFSAVPSGTWSVIAIFPGYQTRATSGTIARPGDSVELPALVLQPNGGMP